MPVRLSRKGLRPAAAVALACISLVAAAAVGSLFLSGALDAWSAVAAPGPAGPADGILLISGLVGTLLSLWVGLGMTLSALSELPGALGQLSRRLAGRVAPAVVRKIVAFILGTTLTAALIPGTAVAGIGHGAAVDAVVTSSQSARHPGSGVAAAAPDASFRLVSGPPAVTPVPVPAHGAANAVQGQDAAPAPTWSTKPPAPPSSPPPGLRRALGDPCATEAVVVLRGDTLWSIAARHLGPGSRPADIEQEWHRWLATNRAVIGDDADLILPGQLLRPPPSTGSGS